MIKHQLAVRRIRRSIQYALRARYVHIRRFFRTGSHEECTIKTFGGVFRKIKIKLLFKINESLDIYHILTFFESLTKRYLCMGISMCLAGLKLLFKTSSGKWTMIMPQPHYDLVGLKSTFKTSPAHIYSLIQMCL